jgi:hypothetical protein
MTRIDCFLMIWILFISSAFASDSGVIKGNFVSDGKNIELKYGYAWLEPEATENDFVLQLLFSEKPQIDPQNQSKFAPISVNVNVQLTSPDFVRFGSEVIAHEGPVSMLSTSDRIVLTSFDSARIEGRTFHESSEHKWDIEFSLPLLTVKTAEPIKAVHLGERLPADGGAVGEALRSYLKALKSGDPGSIRKFTKPEFGKMFSTPEVRVRLMGLKDTFRDDVEILSGFSNGIAATVFVKPAGSNNGSEMGIIKLVLVKNEWKVSADIFTKFY